MSRTNETRHIKWHKTCKYKCKCRLDASICKGFIKDLLGILVIVTVNVINHAIMESI